MIRVKSMLVATAGAALIALVACGEPSATDVAATDGPEPRFASSGPVLVECPIDTTLSVTDTLDALGGSVELNGHRLELPEGAVMLPTEFTLTVPESNYMEIDLKANGAESFEFEETVAITISYERCTRSNIDKDSLSAWKIDPATKDLLRDMRGDDDKIARTVLFDTDSLSGYAIAN